MAWRGYEIGSRDSTPHDEHGAIDELLHKPELEIKKDIRGYLRKWSTLQDNSSDPVRGPGTSNPLPLGESTQWMGNMLNDNQDGFNPDVEREAELDAHSSEFSTLFDEYHDPNSILEPGDLVGLSSAVGTVTVGIYIRSVQKQEQFYTSNGKWRISPPREHEFVIKNFVSTQLAAALNPYLPDTIAVGNDKMQSFIEGGVPRPIGAPLLRELDIFDKNLREIYRAHSPRLDNIYNILADDTNRREYTLKEIACKVLDMEQSQLNPSILFAVHKAILRFPFIIDRDRTSPFTDHYLVHPKELNDLLETVGGWVREHQDYISNTSVGRQSDFQNHPIQQFIAKAQRLIRNSRKYRSATTMACTGPTTQRLSPDDTVDGRIYQVVETEPFSPTDRMIIKYLQLYSIPPRRMIAGILRVASSHIMRATGMYGSINLHGGSVSLMLQELGVISPWDNLGVLYQSIALPGHDISAESESSHERVLQASQKMTSGVLKDSMEDLRIDWGDLPVYCVDSLGTQEVDDGFSLDRIPGSTEEYWIRVHIANPSAFIPKENFIAKYAASRLASTYVPERTYRMLPADLTDAHLSLAPGRPTLTFSCRMNTNGEILEYSIANGRIHNVISLTPDMLSQVLTGNPKVKIKKYRVGGEFPSTGREEPTFKVTAADKDNFHLLRKLVLALREQRKKKGAMDYPRITETAVTVYSGNKPIQPHSLKIKNGQHYLGDPIIEVEYQDFDAHEIEDRSKTQLVSLLMNLGCMIAAHWSAERQIPLFYDGTRVHPEYPALTNENIHLFGGDNWLSFAAPKGVTASIPLPHSYLGVDAYTKATSPLRRFQDFLAHHQIESALRFENKYNKKFNGQTNASCLAYSHEEVQQFLKRAQWLGPHLKDIQRQSQQFWGCLFLFRAFYFHECELPGIFPCQVFQPLSNIAVAEYDYTNGYIAYILPFGLRAQLFLPDDFEDQLSMLSVVEARIIEVDMARRVVILEAVRKIKDFERTGEWA